MIIYNYEKDEFMIEEIISVARHAGDIAMAYFRHHDKMRTANKLNDSDIVTNADKECETYIKEYIHTHYPDHAILSEESGITEGTDDWRWVIDPIDGTSNFYAGLPIWAISIGVEHRGVKEYGVVYLPATGEMFHAIKGKGAFMNGEPIRVSDIDRSSRSLISTGFPVDKDTNPDNNLDNLAKIMPKVRDIRRLGSAAADICYVAAGFLEGYWELNLHEWDINAAALILEEAGGRWSRFREDRGISIVCGSPVIHRELIRLLKS